MLTCVRVAILYDVIVLVHTSGGASYIPGNAPGGFDPDISVNVGKENTYFKAQKIDLGLIPDLHSRLEVAEANLTATHATLADLMERVAKMESWAMEAPVPAEKNSPPSCTGGSSNCAPEVLSEDGTSLSFAATGGAVTFESGGCDRTDLCDLKLDVDALKAKFQN